MSASDVAGVKASAIDERAAPPKAAVLVWLYGLAGLVAAMVLVGGATRLTDSGLSITEWLPVRGVLPPISEQAWNDAFDKYRRIPEYEQVNAGMSLAAFKTIYWWEWTHRLLGRAIGVAFLLPFVAFLALGLLKRRHVPPLLALFALGGLQGAVGWWMVASGLVDRVDVSQYRLAIHLTLACVIFVAILWVARTLDRRPGRPDPLAVRATAAILLALVLAQIFLGGLVAGLDAGLAHNTWPLMDGKLVPTGLLIQQPFWLNAFENARTVQFNHRMAAYGLILLAAVHVVQLLRATRWAGRRRAAWVGGALLLQAAVGVATLLAMVPLELAMAHQAGALLVLAVVTSNLLAARGYGVPVAAGFRH